MSAPRRRRLLSLVPLALAAAALVAWWLWPSGEPDALPEGVTVYADPRPLPAVTLRDKRGGDWTPEALRSHWSVLTFGCTECPARAPETLTRLDLAVEHLERRGRFPPHPVFVTIAPDTDTPERVRAYLNRFNPWFEGLTGTAEAIAELRAAADIRDGPGPLLLIDPQARIAAQLPASLSGEALGRGMGAAIRKLSKSRE